MPSLAKQRPVVRKCGQLSQRLITTAPSTTLSFSLSTELVAANERSMYVESTVANGAPGYDSSGVAYVPQTSPGVQDEDIRVRHWQPMTQTEVESSLDMH